METVFFSYDNSGSEGPQIQGTQRVQHGPSFAFRLECVHHQKFVMVGKGLVRTNLLQLMSMRHLHRQGWKLQPDIKKGQQ